MNPMFSSTKVLDSPTDSGPPGASLELLTRDVESTSLPTAHYSSIHQAALSLVTCASEQAGVQAAVPYREPSTPQEQLAEERRKSAIQRANAEHARRAAECARSAFRSLLEHLTQPCLAVDDIGRVARWNASLALQTGISEQNALGQPLTNLFPLDTASQIEAANMALREAAEADDTPETDPAFVLQGEFVLGDRLKATRITLLPLFHLPGIVEFVIVLLDTSRV